MSEDRIINSGNAQHCLTSAHLNSTRVYQPTGEEKKGQLAPEDLEKMHHIISKHRESTIAPKDLDFQEKIRYTKTKVKECISSIRKDCGDLAKHPIIEAFLNDCENIDHESSTGFSKTIKLMRDLRSNFFIGAFENVGRGKGRGLEFSPYSRLKRSDFIDPDLYNQHGFCPVFIDHELSTDGISPGDKAIFPSQFIGDNPEEANDKIYFINTFFNEFMNITKLLLDSGLATESSFKYIRDYLKQDIDYAQDWTLLNCIIAWGAEHEGAHTQPPLAYYDKAAAEIKNTYSTGAFEELRCDLKAILNRLKEAKEKHPGEESKQNTEVKNYLNKKLFVNPQRSKEFDSRLAGEFVLSERIIRYPLQMDIEKDFDSRASQTLFRYMLDHGVISVLDGVLNLSSNLDNVVTCLGSLDSLLNKIATRVEEDSDNLTDTKKRKMLASVIQDYGGYNRYEQTFVQHPFYKAAAERFKGYLK